jgi:hypothetical protein
MARIVAAVTSARASLPEQVTFRLSRHCSSNVGQQANKEFDLMCSNHKKCWLTLVASFSLAVSCSVAHAATIANLFNTGVDPSANALVGAGVPDPHYSLIVQPGAATAVTVDNAIWPIFGGPWVPNNPLSRWIGPDGSSQGPAGNYTYRTTFNVPANAILSSVNVSGLWGTDDGSIDILINGSSTGSVSAGFTSLVPFNIGSGFVFGVNTLDFALNNAGGPTGLRVDKVVGTYQVPEPATAFLVLSAMSLSVLVLRRVKCGPQRS